MSRFRLDRHSRNLFGPIFRFGQGGTRSFGRSYGRGRSASLSSEDGFVFNRINSAPTHNQINIVFSGMGDENRIQINENSHEYEEM